MAESIRSTVDFKKLRQTLPTSLKLSCHSPIPFLID